jgi:antirestriction protein ArdC
LDCRGYRQWQEVGRQVQRGTHGAYILVPRLVKKQDDETGEEKQVLIGFLAGAVHPLTNTEGDPIAQYQPEEPPPLLDVAQAMGISTDWMPVGPDELGHYSPDEDRIVLGTTDVKTFFHELAHAAHKRVNGKLKGGQDTHQEAVAELAATVLMHLYGFGDRTGNAWAYIAYYSDEPLEAITKALGDVELVLEVLLNHEGA